MPRLITSPAEAQALVGESLGTSEPILIDQARIEAFADVTGDHQWIHTDPERAASSMYGATIAHGCLTLSLVPKLAGQIYTLGFGTARINYGTNKVRFPSPVTVGSTLRATAEFVDVRRDDRATYLTTRCTVTADGAPRPACVAETVVLVVGQDPQDAPQEQT